MSTRAIVLSLFVIASGCAAPRSSTLTLTSDASASKLVFLTRDGCVNTATMRANLDAALKSLSVASSYDVVDQGTLPEGDIRRGYPTPTLLYGNSDVFGMPAPSPPLPDPT
jgi:hypothetical protein